MQASSPAAFLPYFLPAFQSACPRSLNLYIACHGPGIRLCPGHRSRTKTQARPSKAVVQEQKAGTKAGFQEEPCVSPASGMGEEGSVAPCKVLHTLLAHARVLLVFHPHMESKVLVPELLLPLESEPHSLNGPDVGSCLPPNKITFSREKQEIYILNLAAI